MWDLENSQYHKRRREGKATFNPMRQSSFSQEWTEGEWEWIIYSPSAPEYVQRRTRQSGTVLTRASSSSQWYDNGTGLLVSRPVVPDSDVSSLIGECATDARAGVRSGNAEGLESLFQLQQTLQLLRSPLLGMAKLWKAFMKSPASWRTASALSAEYLKLRYGLMPLVSDVRAIAKALDGLSSSTWHSSRSKGALGDQLSVVEHASIGNLVVDFQTDFDHQVNVRAVSLDAYNLTLATELGVHMDRLPYTLYNLIPFSFVADWFWNLGSYVAASTPRAGINHLGGCVMVENSYVSTQYPIATHSINAKTVVTIPMSGSIVKVARTRERGTTLPPNKVVMRSSFGFERFTRVADAAALLMQQVAGARQRYRRHSR